MDKPVSDAANDAIVSGYNNTGEVDTYNHCVDEISQKVERIEQKMDEIEQCTASTSKKQVKASKGSSSVKDKHIPGLKKHLQEASRMEAAAAKRMQDLMRQFGTILNQASCLATLCFSCLDLRVTRHKFAWPFMQPVDVEGLGLDDYFEVIDKPMDFSTIKNQMEARDGTGYKNVRQICADVRLVFKNAMKYNDEKSDVYDMAKTLLKKFDEKWLQLLPKVLEEEKRREAEVAEIKLMEQLAHEAAYAKVARDVSNELNEIDAHLEELREMVVLKCRKFSVEDKRRIGAALARMSPENLTRALEIVAEADPTFQPAAEVVNLDIDAQSESTLWRLKFFVNDNLEGEGDGSGLASVDDDDNNREEDPSNDNNTNNIDNSNKNNNYKRKREISDAIAKAAKKKRQKPNS
ncbi:Transcription factor GTE1 [Morus notabilis]|uniref:Transcription factor GTE1 n=1 Tax=Morus notabilis TaxID=981085 RepID=W9RIS5_9ROSA|nr:Transcription factor GTE1 [Morus notabilis]